MKDFIKFIETMPETMIMFDKALEMKGNSPKVCQVFGLPSLLAKLKKGELKNRIEQDPSFMATIKKSVKRLHHVGSKIYSRWTIGKKNYELTVFSFKIKKDLMYGVYFKDVSYKYEENSPFSLEREFLQKIINNLPVGITVVDQDYQVYAINKTQIDYLKEISGDMEHMIGFDINYIFPDSESSSWRELINAAKESDVDRLQFIDEYHEGIFQYTISPFSNDRGNKGTIIVCEDITQRKRMEDELREVEDGKTRLELLEKVVVTLRHEVFNVITPIMMNSELIQTMLDDGQEMHKELSQNIIDETIRLKDFIEGLSSINEIKTVDYVDNADDKMILVNQKETKGKHD